MMRVGSKSFIEVDKDAERDALGDKDFGRACKRRDERENSAHGSTSEPSRRDETLAKPSAEEDWQEVVAPDPAFYLNDNGLRKRVRCP